MQVDINNRTGQLDTPVPRIVVSKRRFWQREWFTGVLLMAPAGLMILILIGYPLLRGTLMSFQDLYLVAGVDSATWIGLDNFRQFFADPKTPLYFKNTAIYVIGSLVTQLGFGLLIAVLLNRALRWRGVLRSIALIPWVMPTLVAALVWRWILDGQWGILNYILMGLGLTDEPTLWLGERDVVWISVILVSMWRHFPFWYVNILAGLQVIPQELYEVAKIDGASAPRRFWHITLPMLRPILVVLILLETIWRANEFTIIFALTKGGPGNATMTLAPFIYLQSFSFYQMGYAAAVSVVLTIAMMIVTVIYLSRIRMDI